jgi:hypothetical protein
LSAAPAETSNGRRARCSIWIELTMESRAPISYYGLHEAGLFFSSWLRLHFKHYVYSYRIPYLLFLSYIFLSPSSSLVDRMQRYHLDKRTQKWSYKLWPPILTTIISCKLHMKCFARTVKLSSKKIARKLYIFTLLADFPLYRVLNYE